MTCEIGQLLDALIQSTSTDDPTATAELNTMAIDPPGSESAPATDRETSSVPKNSSEPSSGPTSNGMAQNESANTLGHRTLSSTPSNGERRPRLDRLLSALDAPLNPLTASFISRVLVHLAVQRGQEVIPYFRASPNLLERVLSRFDLTAMPDFLLQLAQQERGSQQLILEWFIADGLVTRLIDGFSPDKPWQVHDSVAYCLIQSISTLRNYLSNNTLAGPDSDSSTAFESGLPATSPYAMLMTEDGLTYIAATKLLDILESEETMNAILDHLTNHQTVTTSIVVNCIDVFSAILDKRRPETGFALSGSGGGPGSELEQLFGAGFFGSSNPTFPRGGGGGLFGGSSEDPNRDKSELVYKTRVARASATLARACLPRVHDLHLLLQRPHVQTYNQMSTTTGTLNPPLGRGRLAVAQFFALLMALPVETGIAAALIKEGVIKTLMDLFEQYPFNTLIHQAVTDVATALFSRARLIDTNHGKSGSELEKPQADGSLPLTTAATETSAATNQPNEVETTMDTGATNELESDQTSDKFMVTLLDDAFATIVKENQITDWCLRLAPLSCSASTQPTDVHSPHPKNSSKPGYAGHLWKLANSLEEARNGPRRDFVNQVFESLSEESRSSWDAFVADSLAKVNAVQVADDVSDAKPDRDDGLIQLLTQKDLGSLFSQSAGFFNLSSGPGGSGKFSLFLSPFSFGDQLNNKTSSGSRFGLTFGNLSGDRFNDNDDVGRANSSISTAMWIDTGEAENDPDSPVKPAPNLNDETAFRSARIASLSSDESEPDEDRNNGDDGDDEDDDEEEEDLKSPAVIRQQRSGANRISPVMGISAPAVVSGLTADPWETGTNGSDGTNEVQTGWAQFEESKDQSNPQADVCITFPPSASSNQVVNGLTNQQTAETQAQSKVQSDVAPDLGSLTPTKNASLVLPTTGVP
ncbi:serine/threonine-protein phosphatase 6 regulatory subunit 3 [Clonorchis sinensis]|uniref:Serine/threonine-protein phosphatase 6 regulatory subunit 3 n=1 Tax=Clonorchis sinensis TaxID=79923 RepID=G7YEH4_CLOSI|nr:serine/threonine-protein phosphatase 6 regulatory subunit 3 [Clonorchis sinensis]